jgi:hypothetical protein
MGFKNFLKNVNDLVDEKKPINFFDKSLSGTTIFEDIKICDGYRLFDGKLIDKFGKVIFEYEYKHLGVFYNGFYYAQKSFEAKSWGKFTKDGKKVWVKDFPIHHEITFSDNDTILVLSADCETYKGRNVDFDTILEFDLDGNEVSKWSSFDNLSKLQVFHKKMPLDLRKLGFLDFVKKRKRKSVWGSEYGLYYHMNSISVICENKLGKKDSRFQKGNLIVSCRHGSIIFILDRKTREVVYSLNQFSIPLEMQGQHTPQMLESGNILLFDNGMFRGYSRVIEINPISLEIEWEFRNKNVKFSEYQGSVYLLPNLNYLITYGEFGCSFEVTKKKKIVWKFYHPEVQGKDNSKFKQSYGKRQTIYRMSYYDKKILK